MDTSYKGFILPHSAPKFVQIVNGKLNLTYPAPQSVYGQHFMCMTIGDAKTFNQYGEALLVDRPYVYEESFIPSALQASVPNLVKLLDNTKKLSQDSLISVFNSEGGMQFVKYAKSG